jgi:dipeptidyl aminopeptidase/acylaminoacyl peptidase
MNLRAKNLGLAQTTYLDPNGLARNQSSARNLAALASHALKDRRFAEYVQTRRHSYEVAGPEGQKRLVTWKSTNRLLEMEGYDGIKTGTTNAAGSCLVASGHRGGDHLIVVVLGSTSNDGRYIDARNLFRWAWHERGTKHEPLGSGTSKPTVDQVFDALRGVRSFKEVALSPDGKHLAWVEAMPEAGDGPSSRSAIYVMEEGVPGAKPRRITAGDGTKVHEEHDLAWSPDGSRLAFLSDREKPGQLQLYVARVGEGQPRRLTSLTGFVASPSWSPDGKVLGLLFIQDASRVAGPLVAASREVGVIEERIEEQRFTTVEAETGQVRQVSPADLYVYEYDWAPDGKSVVATAAHGSGDNNWYVAELYTILVATGATRPLLQPKMQIACPRWSPDGKSIAFLGGLMSDEGIPAGDIYLVPAAGGGARDLTPDLKASPAWLTWVASTNQILFGVHVDGQSGFATLDPADGKVHWLWKGAEVVTAIGQPGLPSLSLARDGKTSSAIRHSFQHPPEVWAGPLGQWRQRTQANGELRSFWGTVESIRWSSDNFSIQGWLVYPVAYDPSRRYPMVVSVHGGPSWMHRSAWPADSSVVAQLAAAGYFVLLPNPRGSYGQGEAFTRANVKDFGHGDLRDILAGVEEVLRRAPVDERRVGITGWSYGGYMTMWAVTQSHRFRAAVVGAGIANWQSYYGQNQIDQWMIPFFGASVYDDPGVYARSSPINFIKNVKTPTLILVGERDAECPAPQSYEFWHALKTLGVKTQLVVYADEGHAIAQPKHRRDIARRLVAWFEVHLREPAR